MPGRSASHLELPIEGMTCASCANRIERRLNKLDGVTASVNYATEKATVDFDAAATAPGELVAAVAAAGYRAALPAAGPPRTRMTRPAALRRRLLVSAALTLPVLVLAMVPPLQFENWQWLSLTLAAPVVVWGALPFHRAAWANLRHGTATMDTLVSLGVLAAFAWSLYALVHRRRRRARHDHGLRPDPRARRGRRPDLPGDRQRRDRLHPRRPLPRGAREGAAPAPR